MQSHQRALVIMAVIANLARVDRTVTTVIYSAATLMSIPDICDHSPLRRRGSLA